MLRDLRPEESNAVDDATTAALLARRLNMPHAEVDTLLELAFLGPCRRAGGRTRARPGRRSRRRAGGGRSGRQRADPVASGAPAADGAIFVQRAGELLADGDGGRGGQRGAVIDVGRLVLAQELDDPAAEPPAYVGRDVAAAVAVADGAAERAGQAGDVGGVQPGDVELADPGGGEGRLPRRPPMTETEAERSARAR